MGESEFNNMFRTTASLLQTEEISGRRKMDGLENVRGGLFDLDPAQ